jgi:acetylornithine deacetylase/succinyl-diaminopimelate desuccinylase-like protein
VHELVDFLSIPNVASDDQNIRRNASKLIEMMQKRGIQASLLEGGGPPAVFGELKTPGASKTIGLYAHYDGQQVDPAKWATPPFTPSLQDPSIGSNTYRIVPLTDQNQKFDPEFRIFARSASDDKGPIVAMLVALDALKASGIKLTTNLKFFFEGEEEAGSRHLEEMVRRNGMLLKADVWICADGPVHTNRKQTLYFGARGITSVDITVYGANRALHSGHYGNWAPNPAFRLARLLATLKDEDGRVLVEGFYDDVEPLGEEEKSALRQLPDSDPDLMKEYELARTDRAGRSLAELINEPSLNIDGIRSEDVGNNARTIVPSEATATIDMRLVKGVSPRGQVARLLSHIKKQGYVVTSEVPNRETRLKHPLIARVTVREGYRAFRTSMGLPLVKGLTRTIEEVTGEKLILIPTLGGSVPLWVFDEVTRAPIIGLPIVNHDNNQHSANENLRLKNLWDGIEIFARVMTGDWL